MAAQQDSGTSQEQYNLVYTLGVQPGIKRDGTIFESREYSDGEWCRFQRGIPKKIGGYREMFGTFTGVPRGIIASPYNGVNYLFAGNQSGLDVFITGNTLGVGSGPYIAKILPGYSKQTIAANSTTTFDITSTSSPIEDFSTVYPDGTKIIFDQDNPVVYTTVGTPTFTTPTTTVTFTPALGAMVTVTDVWIANETFQTDARNLWQFDLQYSPAGGALKVLAHPGLNLLNIDNGVPSQVLYGNINPVGDVWTFEGLSDSTGQQPTYQPISVSGGVCVLYPYIFVYGDNGYIANNHVESTYGTQTLTDWNGATANQINMASSKVVKGIPVRGGTNSPSGLFWATDSLIRVSFTGAAPLYWRYDIISSQISTMSSSSFVEMDGVYYWLGVDRFYQYNGVVSVLPNDKNVNWLFDNMNFTQRQKAWATKVPRYNEIWFFYPRGTATECTDAIIYNVKDKLWYDAGEAAGARRSCGYTTEIFPTPIWCGWDYEVTYSAPFIIIAEPSGEAAPEANQFYVAGDVTGTFSPGDHLSFTNSGNPTTAVYTVATSVLIINGSVPPPGVTLVTCLENFSPAVNPGDVVYYVEGGFPIWQQEYGVNKVTLSRELAITSSFTTCDISWVGGTPSQDTSQGPNRRMHLRRIEPDFVQDGEMTLDIIGRKFARGAEENSGPYPFDPDTGKIDLRVEHREIRLKFTSNTISGNYEMGRLLITAEYGDERP
jgi:hypothetical protein